MRRRQFWLGLASLVRPLDLLGIGLYAVVAVLWTGFVRWGWDGMFWFTAGFAMISAGGYAYNDVRDIRIDQISHPHRPLVTGAVHRRDAFTVMWVTYGLGLFCLTQVGQRVFSVGVVIIALLFLYSYWLKNRQGLLANLILSASLGCLPVYAAWHAEFTPKLVSLVSIVFGLMLSREVLKDIEDQAGDSASGRRTVATSRFSRFGWSVIPLGIGLSIGASFALATLSATGFAIIILDALVCIGVLGWLSGWLSLTIFKHILKIAMFGFVLVFLVMGVAR